MGPGGPVLPDDIRWEVEATDARHKALDNVRATAKEWTTSIGLILGAFTTAAFLKGPEALKDVPADGFKLTAFSVTYEVAPVVVGAVIIGALILALALAAGALAAQGTPGWTTQLTGEDYAVRSMRATKASIRWLSISRIATALAAGLILLGMAIAWTAQLEQPKATETTSAIVGSNGTAVCGTLSTSAQGAVSVTPKGGAAQPVDTLATVTVVDSCP